MFGTDLLSNIFLGMFLFGLIFTIVSLVLGFVHAGDLHIPHLGEVGDIAHGGHVGDVGHVAHADGFDGPGVLNMPTIMAFITWLGGVGYILRSSLGLSALIVVPLAVISGLIGGAIMFFLLARVLWPMMSKPLRSADYRLPGTPARVVSSIREGGVGEIVYSKAGSRFTAGARAEDGRPIAKGVDVVIISYERGLAIVRSVDDLLRERERELEEEVRET
jgi:hypothetical protein